MAGPTGGASNPINVINDGAMNSRQWVVVLLMVLLNALDGFDVLSSAFAAPGISAEWGIERAALGVVLSAELVGMGFGSVLLGGAADKFGRKNTMIACLLFMAAGMWMAGHANAVTPMIIYRFITGIGIGGMLAATNAVTAESTNSKWRKAAIAVYVAGYPLGAILGGIAASEWLLDTYGWRGVFDFGAIVTAALIPVVMLVVPETAAYHAGKGNLEGTNKTLAAFGKEPIAALPPIHADDIKPKVTDILSNPQLRPVTLLLAFGYMFHTITFYYILKFAVQIVADYPPGYEPSTAATVLTWANVGGFPGERAFRLRDGAPWYQMAHGADAADRFCCRDFLRPWSRDAGRLAMGNGSDRVLHKCRDQRILRRFRTRIPGLCPCHGHRLRAGHRPIWCGWQPADCRRAVCVAGQ